MDILSGAVVLPLIAAALHPVLGWCVQKSSKAGVGLVLNVAIANLMTTVVFASFLRPEGGWRLGGLDWLAMGIGVLFFFGQWFSIRAIKGGHLGVHSSALGLKLLMVAALAAALGLEGESPWLFVGAVFATVSVFLVAGGNLAGWREHRGTVGWTLAACVCFALIDTMTGWKGGELGGARWLLLMMGTSGLMSLGLLASRGAQFTVLVRKRRGLGFVLGAGVALGVQALLVNLAFTHYGQPTLSNVAFSTRGVMAVVFLWVIGQGTVGERRGRQLAGAALMVVALAVSLM